MYSIDPDGIARVEPSVMDDQTLLELVVVDFDGVEVFQSSNGDFLDIHRWDGVTVDSAQNIHSITFCGTEDRLLDPYDDDYEGNVGPGGTIHLDWLPTHIASVDVSCLNVKGTISTERFPRTLVYFTALRNQLTGTFATIGLPPVMQSLCINGNAFHGSLNVTTLPATMEHFSASSNKFSGTLDLTNLGTCIRSLCLDENLFTGPVDIGQLSPSLEVLLLYDNSICQDTLTVGDITRNVKSISILRGNTIGKIIDKKGRPFRNTKLR